MIKKKRWRKGQINETVSTDTGEITLRTTTTDFLVPVKNYDTFIKIYEKGID